MHCLCFVMWSTEQLNHTLSNDVHMLVSLPYVHIIVYECVLHFFTLHFLTHNSVNSDAIHQAQLVGFLLLTQNVWHRTSNLDDILLFDFPKYELMDRIKQANIKFGLYKKALTTRLHTTMGGTTHLQLTLHKLIATNGSIGSVQLTSRSIPQDLILMSYTWGH